jgi:hypothetical protein
VVVLVECPHQQEHADDTDQCRNAGLRGRSERFTGVGQQLQQSNSQHQPPYKTHQQLSPQVRHPNQGRKMTAGDRRKYDQQAVDCQQDTQRHSTCANRKRSGKRRSA